MVPKQQYHSLYKRSTPFSSKQSPSPPQKKKSANLKPWIQFVQPCTQWFLFAQCAPESKGIWKGGDREEREASARPFISTKSLRSAAYKILLSSANGWCWTTTHTGSFVVNSLFQGQIPAAPSALHSYHSTGILSLTPKGISPRPVRHRVANIAEWSFEVAYGWNLVNTNRVRCCPAFAL